MVIIVDGTEYLGKEDYIAANYRVVLCELCGKANADLFFNEAGEVICENCIEIEEDDPDAGGSYRLTYYTIIPGTFDSAKHEETFENDSDDWAIGEAEMLLDSDDNERPLKLTGEANLVNETTGERVATWDCNGKGNDYELIYSIIPGEVKE